MAVFTSFSKDQLERYLMMFRLGDLELYHPILAGTENSNYFVTLIRHGVETEYVLTLFESLGIADLPYFSQLMSSLHHYGLAVPSPLSTLDGMTTTIFCGKPAILFPRLPGAHVMHPDQHHCQAIGTALSQLHTTDLAKNLSRENEFNLPWFKTCRDELSSFFNTDDYQLLCRVVDEYENYLAASGAELPKGVIHGDLFRDNALFVNGELSGLIDFYHSCTDYLTLDLSIAINDWCHDNRQRFDPGLYHALLDGYAARRTLSKHELLSLPIFLRVAAAKFWIRRSLLAQKGEKQRDPEEFKKILMGWYGESLELLS
ncbi:MAG: homoserine kinase [Gammaproteobacteria bacterium]|nr:homoserine kinase [Gammaproteobacteria bacterium]